MTRRPLPALGLRATRVRLLPILGIVLIVAGVAGLVRTAAAPTAGKLEARHRISAYDHFYDLWLDAQPLCVAKLSAHTFVRPSCNDGNTNRA